MSYEPWRHTKRRESKSQVLIGRTEKDQLCVLLGLEDVRSLEAVGNLFLKLNLVVQRVGSVPCLGDGQAVGLVRVGAFWSHRAG